MEQRVSVNTLVAALSDDGRAMTVNLVHLSVSLCTYVIDAADRKAFAALAAEHRVSLTGPGRWDAAGRDLTGMELRVHTDIVPGRAYAAAYAVTFLGLDAALEAGNCVIDGERVPAAYANVQDVVRDAEKLPDPVMLIRASEQLARQVLVGSPLTAWARAIVGWIDEKDPYATDVPVLDPVTETLTTLLADVLPAGAGREDRDIVLAHAGRIAWNSLHLLETARALAAEPEAPEPELPAGVHVAHLGLRPRPDIAAPDARAGRALT